MPLFVVAIGQNGHVANLTTALKTSKDIILSGFAKGVPEDKNIARFINPEYSTKDIKVWDDYKEMLDIIKPDIAVLTPQFHQHTEMILECCKRKINVMCEKPIALNMNDLNKIKEAVSKSNIKISTMLGSRTNPKIVKAKELIKDGIIGEPILITAQKSYKAKIPAPLWQTKKELFGGLIPWVGIHAIDFTRFVSGIEPISVTAHNSQIALTMNGDMEDNAVAIYKLKNNGSQTINVDYLRPHSANTHGDDRLRIAGTKGIIEVIDYEDNLVLINENGTQKIECKKVPSIMENFIGSILGKNENIFTFEDIYRSAEITIKTQESANTGKTIEL